MARTSGNGCGRKPPSGGTGCYEDLESTCPGEDLDTTLNGRRGSSGTSGTGKCPHSSPVTWSAPTCLYASVGLHTRPPLCTLIVHWILWFATSREGMVSKPTDAHCRLSKSGSRHNPTRTHRGVEQHQSVQCRGIVFGNEPFFEPEMDQRGSICSNLTTCLKSASV